MKIGGHLGVSLFRLISHGPEPKRSEGNGSHEPHLSGARKLERYFGSAIWNEFAGKTVLDFGCGSGFEAVAAAHKGAEVVYGIDIRDRLLEDARILADKEGVGSHCVFLHAQRDSADIENLRGMVNFAYSLDSFEHYADPKTILDLLYGLLVPGGSLYVSFGPPWRHPRGGHMFFLCSIPWFHLIFSEQAILTVRAQHRTDGAKSFGEVEGGLNQMTVGQFTRLIQEARFRIRELRLIPIKGLSVLTKSNALREYFTSVVRCTLIK